VSVQPFGPPTYSAEWIEPVVSGFLDGAISRDAIYAAVDQFLGFWEADAEASPDDHLR
jgi:hypothetical protein